MISNGMASLSVYLLPAVSMLVVMLIAMPPLMVPPLIESMVLRHTHIMFGLAQISLISEWSHIVANSDFQRWPTGAKPKARGMELPKPLEDGRDFESEARASFNFK
jgi:hypothetical protein